MTLCGFRVRLLGMGSIRAWYRRRIYLQTPTSRRATIRAAITMLVAFGQQTSVERITMILEKIFGSGQLLADTLAEVAETRAEMLGDQPPVEVAP